MIKTLSVITLLCTLLSSTATATKTYNSYSPKLDPYSFQERQLISQLNSKTTSVREAAIENLSMMRSYKSSVTRAFSNMRIQGPRSPHSLGTHELQTLRNTRSGCGIMMVNLPSSLHRPVIPSAEPFGLSG